MVGSCSVEDAHSNAVFNTVIGIMDTAVSIAFYKARFENVRERGHTVVPNFAGPSDLDLFRNLSLVFDGAKYSEMEGRKAAFFRAIFETFKRKRIRKPPVVMVSIG